MTRIKNPSPALRVALAAIVSIAAVAVFAAAAAAQEEPDRDYWVNRYETLVSEVDSLRVKVDVLNTNYVKARQRNYPRGTELYAMKAKAEEATAELEKKEEELENFPDEARRAGAYPGWFRDLD